MFRKFFENHTESDKQKKSAELIFNYLYNQCKDSSERNEYLIKISSTKGGRIAIDQAIILAKENSDRAYFAHRKYSSSFDRTQGFSGESALRLNELDDESEKAKRIERELKKFAAGNKIEMLVGIKQ